MRVIAAILALAASASAMTLNHEKIFADWKRQFGKTYSTSGELPNLNLPIAQPPALSTRRHPRTKS